jgi:hypothetical protein
VCYQARAAGEHRDQYQAEHGRLPTRTQSISAGEILLPAVQRGACSDEPIPH